MAPVAASFASESLNDSLQISLLTRESAPSTIRHAGATKRPQRYRHRLLSMRSKRENPGRARMNSVSVDLTNSLLSKSVVAGPTSQKQPVNQRQPRQKSGFEQMFRMDPAVAEKNGRSLLEASFSASFALKKEIARRTAAAYRFRARAGDRRRPAPKTRQESVDASRPETSPRNRLSFRPIMQGAIVVKTKAGRRLLA